MSLLPTLQSPLVSTGLWWDSSEPHYQRWIWTVTNMNALIVLGVLMVFAMLSQTQAWNLLRSMVTRITTPIRLPTDSDPIKTLSQMNALSSLIKSAGRGLGWKGKSLRTDTEQESVTISPWFGICCLFNGSIFLTLGIFITWFLAEGLQGEPIVRSHVPARCFGDAVPVNASQGRQRTFHENCSWEWVFLKRRWQLYCRPTNPTAPDIRQSKNRLFPFDHPRYQFLNDHGDWGIQPERFVQRIALRDLGLYNSSTMALYHELTCKPISLDSFIDSDGWSSSLDSGLPTANRTANHPEWRRQFSSIIELGTSNGQGSGREEYQLRPDTPFEVVVTPTILMVNLNFQPADILDFVVQGVLDTFLITFKAYGTRYRHSMDDSFFSAHMETEPEDGLPAGFIADREITALGCVEYFDICVLLNATESCYSRADVQKSLKDNNNSTRQNEDRQDSEWIALLAQASPFLSLAYNLQRDPGLSYANITWDSQSHPGQAIVEDTGTWRRQVAGWYAQSLPRAQQGFKNAAEKFLRNQTTVNGGDTGLDADEFCDAILFYDIDYTDINFIGFCAVLCTFIFICTLAPAVKVLNKIWTMIQDLFREAWNFARSLLERATALFETIRNLILSLNIPIAAKLALIPTALHSWRSAGSSETRRNRDPLHDLGSVVTPSINVVEPQDPV